MRFLKWKFKEWLIEKILHWLVPSVLNYQDKGLDEKEKLGILFRTNQVDGLEKLLNSIINDDMLRYYRFYSDQQEERLIRKGMIIRTFEIIKGMQNASEQLRKLGQQHENISAEHF